ncbi:MAG: DUF1844 domain-containing protein [Candidatus Omnitrophota bacterium]
MGYEVTANINSIVLLLATQAMINMGEIQDPITGQRRDDMQGALVFLQLLDVLETKTKQNLTPEEATFMAEVKENLDKIYNKKYFSGTKYES